MDNQTQQPAQPAVDMTQAPVNPAAQPVMPMPGADMTSGMPSAQPAAPDLSSLGAMASTPADPMSQPVADPMGGMAATVSTPLAPATMPQPPMPTMPEPVSMGPATLEGVMAELAKIHQKLDEMDEKL
ncbi:MAG TPA: hypothetical protein VFQ63_03000 [Patescibacteria group bacterium]|nr:hypothetical protein [Patescibacteria group bacterium]